MVGLVSSIFIIAGRFIVKIFITVFGWAMVIFFGKIPEEKSGFLAAISILSVVWILLIVGVVYPAITQAFYNYIPDDKLKYLISMILESLGIILIPMIVGELSLFVEGKKNRKWKDYLKVMLIGYYYSILMGVSMLIMFLFAPIITVKRYLLRQRTHNMSLIIQTGRAKNVVETIYLYLKELGEEVELKRARILYRLPMVILQNLFERLLQVDTKKTKMIQSDKFKIYFNPMDVMIEGEKEKVDQISAYLFQAMVYDDSFMTCTQKAQEVEKEALFIYRLYCKCMMDEKEGLGRLDKLRKKMLLIGIDYEEWEILNTQILYFERDILLKNRK